MRLHMKWILVDACVRYIYRYILFFSSICLGRSNRRAYSVRIVVSGRVSGIDWNDESQTKNLLLAANKATTQHSGSFNARAKQ